MIEVVVLDVDGVIVGDQEGINFPHPHSKVIKCLKKVRQRGIYVSLCTGKPAFAIEKIVNEAYLNNLHIVDGGAVGIDPINKKISFRYTIEQSIILQLTQYYFPRNIYMEFYNGTEYFVFKTQINELTRLHSAVLEEEPKLIESINYILKQKDIVKIILWVKDDEQKEFISKSFTEQFGKDLVLGWTSNPNMALWKIGLITKKGVSKRKGVENISKYINVPLEHILGIGDTMIDWSFIEICGYGGTVGNASEKLKELVLKKGHGHGFVGRGVNENGVIDVLRHFRLV